MSYSNTLSKADGPLRFGVAPDARNAKAIGRDNRSAVLRAVRWHGPLSRGQIAELVGLSSATAFYIVDELKAMNLIVEDGVASSGLGRPPTVYRFNSQACYALGVNVSGMGTVELVTTDLDGQVLARNAIQLPAEVRPEILVDAISTTARDTVAQSGIAWEKIGGIGVAMHGLVDTSTGTVVWDAYKIYASVPLQQMLAERVQLPTYITSHRFAVALGEKWCGAGRDLDTFACVNTGIGVGVGLILDGRSYTGSTGLAGRHIGHMVVNDNGPLCSCGKHGCLQMYAGGKALVEKTVWGLRLGAVSAIANAVEGNFDRITPTLVAQSAAQGDTFAIGVMQEAGRHLGIAIAWLIHVLSPQAIIVGGHVVQAGNVVLDAIKEAVSTRALGEVVENVPIIAAGLGSDADAVGAAILVLGRELTL